jgi:hypothetical protein
MWKGSETTFETNSETRGKNMHMKLLNEKKRVQLTPRCIRGRIVTMHSWLSEVGMEYSLPGLIKGDNSGAIALTKNTKDHGKIKHIDIRHHYIRELLHSGKITMEQVPSANNLADLFTIPLSCDHHHRILEELDIK